MKNSVLKSVFLVVVTSFTLAFAGCGGGSSSTTEGNSTTEGTSTTTTGNPAITVSGMASLGPIKGGKITIYALDSAGTIGDVLGTAFTDGGGTYSVNVGSYSGNILVTLAGGHYIDEATLQVLINKDTLRAALTNVSGNVSVSVTQFTEIAVQKAIALGGLSEYNIEFSNNIVSNMLGAGIDIVKTLPFDTTTYRLLPIGTTQSEIDYGIMLGVLSKMIDRGDAASVADVISQIASDLSDNQIDKTGDSIDWHLFVYSTWILGGQSSELRKSIVDSTEYEIKSTLVPLSNASLKGSYTVFSKDNGFFSWSSSYTDPDTGKKYYAYGADSDESIHSGTLTFDGQGGCTWSDSGIRLSGKPSSDSPAVSFSAEQPYSGTCTYSLAADGTLTFGDGSIVAVSADGNIITGIESENRLSIDNHAHVRMTVGVKKGQGLSNASIKGSYAISSKESGFSSWSYLASTDPDTGKKYYVYGADSEESIYSGTLTFDGQGGCTWSDSGIRLSGKPSSDSPAVSFSAEQPYSGTCTYSLAADGTLTFGDGSIVAVSADGNIITGIESENRLSIDNHAHVGMTVGVKKGQGLSNASIKGSYAISSKESGFSSWSYLASTDPDTGKKYYVYGADSEESIYSGTLTFDGQGGCSWSDSGIRLSGKPSSDSPAVSFSAEQPYSGTCTYSLAADGTLTFGDGSIVVVSPNGIAITGIESENRLSIDNHAHVRMTVGVKKGNN